MDDGVAVGQLVVAGNGGKVFDDWRQANAEGVELTCDDTVELKGPAKIVKMMLNHIQREFDRECRFSSLHWVEFVLFVLIFVLIFVFWSIFGLYLLIPLTS